jgi:hypothetical protein
MEIVIGRTVDPSALFASEADMDAVDVQASAERFDDILVKRVQAAYPDAVVKLGDGQRAYGFADEGEILNVIANIVDEITQDGEWIVTDGD